MGWSRRVGKWGRTRTESFERRGLEEQGRGLLGAEVVRGVEVLGLEEMLEGFGGVGSLVPGRLISVSLISLIKRV